MTFVCIHYTHSLVNTLTNAHCDTHTHTHTHHTLHHGTLQFFGFLVMFWTIGLAIYVALGAFLFKWGPIKASYTVPAPKDSESS